MKAVDFSKSVVSVGGLFKHEGKIYVMPTTKYREFFANTKIKNTTGKEARALLGGLNMKYWPHSLILLYGVPPLVLAFHGTFCWTCS